LNEPYRVPVGPAATRYIRKRPKLIVGDKGFWVSLFWDFVGQVMGGLTFLICVPRYPRDFLGLFKQKLAAVGLIALSKILFSVSEAVTLYATLLAPVGSSREFVPARFVFALGIVLTLFYPCIAKEIARRHEDAAKRRANGSHARRWLFDQQGFASTSDRVKRSHLLPCMIEVLARNPQLSGKPEDLCCP
jgi:hypothetical protein